MYTLACQSFYISLEQIIFGELNIYLKRPCQVLWISSQYITRFLPLFFCYCTLFVRNKHCFLLCYCFAVPVVFRCFCSVFFSCLFSCTYYYCLLSAIILWTVGNCSFKKKKWYNLKQNNILFDCHICLLSTYGQ